MTGSNVRQLLALPPLALYVGTVLLSQEKTVIIKIKLDAQLGVKSIQGSSVEESVQYASGKIQSVGIIL